MSDALLSGLIINLASIACGFILGDIGSRVGVPMIYAVVASVFTSAALVGLYLLAAR